MCVCVCVCVCVCACVCVCVCAHTHTHSDIPCYEHWLSPHMYGRVWYYSYAGDLKCAGLSPTLSVDSIPPTPDLNPKP